MDCIVPLLCSANSAEQTMCRPSRARQRLQPGAQIDVRPDYREIEPFTGADIPIHGIAYMQTDARRQRFFSLT